jgi:hypothetical protein
MLTWEKFIEGKGCNFKGMEKKLGSKHIEDMEEKLGKDLDGDDEKDEPLAHKKKVFGKKAEEKED